MRNIIIYNTNCSLKTEISLESSNCKVLPVKWKTNTDIFPFLFTSHDSCSYLSVARFKTNLDQFSGAH